MIVRVVVMPHGVGLPLPRWATAGAAGADIHAAVEAPVDIAPGARAVIPTGLKFAIPEGWEIQVRPRSGLARRGVTVLNAPGTIDCDYRGEVLVILVNHGEATHRVERGDRIAQLVLAPVHRAVWDVVASLDETARGEGGLGSTGR